MPRFVTVQLSCDWTDCTITAEEGSGLVVERVITMDKAPAKGFLLCKEHGDQLDEILIPLLQAGIKVEAPAGSKRKPGGASSGASAPTGGNGHPAEEFNCQEPGCDRVLKNRTGMAQHVIRTHDYESLADYEAVHGLVAA